MTLLCTKVDSLDKELQQMKSQQHDNKYVELSQSEDLKIPELEVDDGKHRKTQLIICYMQLQGAPLQQRNKTKLDMSIQI
ncbi:hypothetical protein MTR67_051379 [Solanum verrucosum]|uniref:Uncharacterized protein n=1 Tax=Solanum verrucosum TaxID=315347 RepID=A0AAF1A2P6_SOLVR|nr:hypothetical protein MTR67_051379 [Solanum verrucosum]